MGRYVCPDLDMAALRREENFVKTLLYLILTVVSVVALAFLLAAGVGFLVYIAIAAVIIGCAVVLVRHWVRKHQKRKYPLGRHARLEKAADRALKDMERTINKQ